MSLLSGALKEIGFPSVVRFVAELLRSGTLHVSDAGWTGEVRFDQGQVRAAALRDARGLAALDAIALALGNGQFTFVDGPPPDERDVDLGTAQLLAHLHDLAGEHARLAQHVPSLDAVPRPHDLVSRTADEATGAAAPGAGEVVLERGALRTLMMVDGRRTVGEIADQRGLLPAVRDLATLVERGLIQVAPPAPAPEVPAPPAAGVGRLPPAPDDSTVVGAAGRAPVDRATRTPVSPPSSEEERPYNLQDPETRGGGTSATGGVQEEDPEGAPALPVLAAVGPCPKLGYDDTPAEHYSRPTQLHRCFALPRPERIDAETQRELCLTNRYPTCPRFAVAMGGASPGPPAGPSRPAPTTATPGARHTPSVSPAEAAAPDAGTAGPAGRQGAARRAAEVPPPETAPAVRKPVLRPMPQVEPLTANGQVAPPARRQIDPRQTPDTQAPESTPAAAGANGAGAVPATVPADPAATETLVSAAPPGLAIRALQVGPAVAGASGHGRPAPPPEGAPGGGEPDALSAGDAVAPAREEGAPQRRSVPLPALPVPRAVVLAALASGVVVLVLVAALVLRGRAGPPPARAPAGTAAAPRAVLDERFGTTATPRNWPNNPQATAWMAADGTYHLLARQPGQFVAVGAPGVGVLRDVAVTASFRKVGGPAGGGYGVIVRDQGPGPRDGMNQGGRYYVFEVGDRGEVGIWRRENDRWVELLPWTASPAVRPGGEPNQLEVLAVGSQLTFRVNGTQVAGQADATLAEGTVGVFAGGDGNEAVVERFTVATPG